jgi:predicted DNA-binding protein
MKKKDVTMKRLKKIPIQIYLEPEQQKIIDVLSKTSGKSKAAIIRSCISEFISTLPPTEDPALDIMNLGASGKKDIAERHDDYLISHEK